VTFQSWSEEKRLRMEYANCDFSVMERGEETKTGVLMQTVIFQSWSEEKRLQ
jgi:hypothetical protein